MRLISSLAVLCIVAASACSSKKQPPTASHSPLADSADQVMYGARTIISNEGVSRARMISDTAYFFDENTRIEVENPVVTFFTATGTKNAVLTARHGTYNTRSNAMFARQNVVVVSEDGRRLTTPILVYNQQKNEISSDSAFVMTEPGRRLEGIGFRSDPDVKNIVILKGASGRISLALLFVVGASAKAQDIPRSCDIELPTGTGTTATIREDTVTHKRTTYLGRGVVAHCIGQGNTLTADSAEYYESEGRLYLVGNVHYTEPRANVTSQTMTYYQGDNHLHAEGNVVATLSNGSVLRGPVADYYRSTQARPLAKLFAPGRPRVTLIQKDTTGRGRPPDTANIVANQINMEGDSLVYASGRVEITRPDLFASGDSAFMDSGHDFARLMRQPSVQGKGTRTFTLTGGVIDLYSRNRQVTTRARAVSPEREIIADSIDAIMPGQRVREVRALRKAYAASNPDSGVVSKQRDWMSGDTIVASFDSIPPGDTTSKPKIREIVAEGNARSFYQMKSSKGPPDQPSVNYVRGRIIDILFEDRKVATVTVTDQATGVMIEPATALATAPKPGTPQTQPKPPAAVKPPIKR